MPERNAPGGRRGALALLALASVAPLLGACGLQPLYGRKAAGGSTLGELQTIRIEPLSDRPGQQLHNALRNEINPRGQPVDPRYRLVVDLAINKQEIGVRKDETATRANLVLSANYALTRVADQVSMTRGVAKSVVSYNIVDSEFGTYAAEEDALERGIAQLAQQMRLRLAAYFERLVGGSASP